MTSAVLSNFSKSLAPFYSGLAAAGIRNLSNGNILRGTLQLGMGGVGGYISGQFAIFGHNPNITFTVISITTACFSNAYSNLIERKLKKVAIPLLAGTSLAAAYFYALPTYQFTRVMGAAFGVGLCDGGLPPLVAALLNEYPLLEIAGP